ncbi:MAG: hypothetical protein JWO07_360 [Candidatus Saccharibacteria bacterium]|nr:hypothetical protein [Candidatus Saccharibacteria bacterium]
MREVLAQTGLMPASSDDLETTGKHDMGEELTGGLLVRELAYSQEVNPLPEELDSDAMSQRILDYNPYRHEFVVAAVTGEQLAEIEERIAHAPNLDEAFKLVEEIHDSNPLDIVSLYEKIAVHYGDSDAATDRIDQAVAHTADYAELAINGQLGSTTPNEGVEALVKAFTVASNPEVKGRVLDILEAAVHSAASAGEIGDGVYELDPEVAQGALEVIEDLKRVSLKQDVDAELLLNSHKNEDLLRRQLAELEAQRAALDAEQASIYEKIGAEQTLRAHEMPARHSIAGVSGLLRFGNRLVS